MASSEFVKQLLIESATWLPVACRHEDVASDVLVHNLAVSGHTAEGNVYISVEFNSNLEH